MNDAILWFFLLSKARQRAVINAVNVLRKAGVAGDEALLIIHQADGNYKHIS